MLLIWRRKLAISEILGTLKSHKHINMREDDILIKADCFIVLRHLKNVSSSFISVPRVIQFSNFTF